MDLRDEGVYTCVATNLAGESKRDVVLKVMGEDAGAGWWVTRSGPSGLPCGAGERAGVLNHSRALEKKKVICSVAPFGYFLQGC